MRMRERSTVRDLSPARVTVGLPVGTRARATWATWARARETVAVAVAVMAQSSPRMC